MVDVCHGSMAGHVPIRVSSDGMSDTMNEETKLFDESNRTGVKVPFRTGILPEIKRAVYKTRQIQSRSGAILIGTSCGCMMLEKVALSSAKAIINRSNRHNKSFD
jgi:hypothetical protein